MWRILLNRTAMVATNGNNSEVVVLEAKREQVEKVRNVIVHLDLVPS